MSKEVLVKGLEKKFGTKQSKLITMGTEFKENKKLIIPVGPKLDMALSGGIPECSWVNISGPKKVGKTTVTLQICANAQKLYNKSVIYLDAENRFKDLNLYGVQGLKLDEFYLIQNPGKVCAEDLLLVLLEFMKDPNFVGSVFVIDSISSLTPKDIMSAEEVTASGRSSTPKMMKNFCKQASPYLNKHHHIVIGIQHLIANTSGYGAPYMEDGGSYVGYQADVAMRGKKAVGILDSDKRQVGQEVTWEILFSALGAPHPPIESRIRYNVGVDEVGELIDLCSDLCLIDKAGAWYTLECIPGKPKAQGHEKCYSLLMENPEYIDILKRELKQLTCAL